MKAINRIKILPQDTAQKVIGKADPNDFASNSPGTNIRNVFYKKKITRRRITKEG